MMEVKRLDNKSLRISVNKDLYCEEVIYKCFYWYGDSYSITIEKDDSAFFVTLSKLVSDLSDATFEQLVNKIKIDLIDYKTRQIIHNETKHLKAILVAKAFSSFDAFDEPPKGTITDPVGFKMD